MNTYYLISAIDKIEGFKGNIINYLKSDIKENSTIAVIASSFDDYEKNDIYYSKTLKFFENIDIFFSNHNLIDSRIDVNIANELVLNSDIVFIMGGNPKNEMDSIKQYDLIDSLNKRKGITIGVSAGAINMASNVIYKDSKILKYEGIGLTDINIYPHLDFDNLEFLKEIFEVSKYKKIVALPNESFIRIKDNEIEYVGDCYFLSSNNVLDNRIHKMNLQDKPFSLIKNGIKKIEMRLYDEKRQKIKIGDIIEFNNNNAGEIIKTEVIDLHKFKNFEDLYKNFDKEIIGYIGDELSDYKDMEQYYEKSDIDKYGVVGIEINKID